MKSLVVLFGVALWLAIIGPSASEPEAGPNHHQHHGEKPIRHRPKRQFSNPYGFNSHWTSPYYPDQRRDDRNQQDPLPQIYRLLNEILDIVRRPPPPPLPPQPIYIPYPIQYPVYCKCGGSNRTPNITSRFPDMEDSNQNWGYDDTQEESVDYTKNIRPINFDRVPPPVYTPRPPPSVDHGTSQAASDSQSTRENNSGRRPQRCDAMVLSCCNPKESRQQQHQCFTISGCTTYFEANDVCSKENVQEALDLFIAAYSKPN